MHSTITIQKRGREFATLYNGEFALARGVAYSVFARKRDAASFGNYLTALFGDRLADADGPRPSTDELAAVTRALAELRPEIRKWL